ncbi:hypothetical protein ENKO_387 [Klebsiella phage fENko-Kae01]|nr:hypothetical protein [Klebsiella phage fENko-Kae01]
MSNMMKKWLVGFCIVLYVLLVMFNVVPGMISAPDTLQNVLGSAIFVFSFPAIYVIIKKVFK